MLNFIWRTHLTKVGGPPLLKRDAWWRLRNSLTYKWYKLCKDRSHLSFVRQLGKMDTVTFSFSLADSFVAIHKNQLNSSCAERILGRSLNWYKITLWHLERGNGIQNIDDFWKSLESQMSSRMFYFVNFSRLNSIAKDSLRAILQYLKVTNKESDLQTSCCSAREKIR